MFSVLERVLWYPIEQALRLAKILILWLQLIGPTPTITCPNGDIYECKEWYRWVSFSVDVLKEEPWLYKHLDGPQVTVEVVATVLARHALFKVWFRKWRCSWVKVSGTHDPTLRFAAVVSAIQTGLLWPIDRNRDSDDTFSHTSFDTF